MINGVVAFRQELIKRVTDVAKFSIFHPLVLKNISYMLVYLFFRFCVCFFYIA